MIVNPLPAIHPGEILREEFLVPLGLTAGRVAKAIGVPRTRIERLVAEKVDMTPDTALRLARYLGTSRDFWLSLQTRYSIETTLPRIEASLAAIEPLKV